MRREDLDLVQRCIAGDKEAWDRFVLRTKAAINRGTGVALRKFRITDQETVENVRQQVYVELLKDDKRTLTTYRGRSDLEGWVSVIAMRTAYRIIRKGGREKEMPEFLPEAPTVSPREKAERTEFLNRLDGAFRQLNQEERGLIWMAFYEDRSYKEIAEALGMPVNSVSPKLIRAKEKLKKFLE